MNADALRQVLEDTRLRRSELDARVADALDPSYWRRLCPALSVGKRRPSFGREMPTLNPKVRGELERRLRHEGYGQTTPLLPASLTRRMGRAVTTLKSNGWPPVFVFVFDEFWAVWRLPSLVGLLKRVLGPGYRLRPHLWCYYVHAVRGARGWPPHADGFGQPGLSVWIPLSDATPENGCIYVVPKDLIVGRVQVGDLFGAIDVPLSTLTDLLQCARAVPATRGSVLLWDFDLVHWGSVVNDALEPRISISAEFVPASDSRIDNLAPEAPPRAGAPGFTDRLRVIVSNIRLFAANDPWTFKYLDLGDRLATALDTRPLGN